MSWLGHEGAALARLLDLPRVEALTAVGSTMDAAHALAADGAPGGTLVIAETQSSGRGRNGRSWSSEPGAGIWMTLIERPRAADGVDVLSLRVGLHLAPVLERWTTGSVRLKWPNDLYVADRKLAGVLIEARWRGGVPDWIAIGLGINVVVPRDVRAASLSGAQPPEVLAEVVPAVRAAAFARGALTPAELDGFARRDLAAGQRVSLPADGTVRGISPAGELLIETAGGVTPHRAGSLVFSDH